MTAPVVEWLSPALGVAPQLSPGAMEWAARSGFKSIINNRPDFEAGPEQPTSAQIEAAALRAGMRYAWLPVLPTVQTPDQITRFAALLVELPTPILAFCRSGTRSGKLHRAASGA